MVESLQTLKKRYCAKVPEFTKLGLQKVMGTISKTFKTRKNKNTQKKIDIVQQKKLNIQIQKAAVAAEKSCKSNNGETFLQGGIGPIDKDLKQILPLLKLSQKKNSKKSIDAEIKVLQFSQKMPLIHKLVAKRFHTSTQKVKKALGHKIHCIKTRKTSMPCHVKYLQELV
jgi:hypothetical protein